MKYFVILIKSFTDKPSSKSIYEYGAYHEAIGAFHSSLGSAMKDATTTECLCIVIDSLGVQCANEHYFAPIDEAVVDEATE